MQTRSSDENSVRLSVCLSVLLSHAKKELFEWSRPVNVELERIAQRERECVERLHRLAAEKHDREKHQQTVQRLIELESELKRLKCENVKLSDTNQKLKQSLDQATKYSKIQKEKTDKLERTMTAADRELELEKAPRQEKSEMYDNSTVRKLRKQLSETCTLLNKAKLESSEMRQRLFEVEERLTLAEQVTAATQRRALRESDSSEELLLELAAQQHPASLTGHVYTVFQKNIHSYYWL